MKRPQGLLRVSNVFHLEGIFNMRSTLWRQNVLFTPEKVVLCLTSAVLVEYVAVRVKRPDASYG